ncbi:unnamed protein product [Bursaphelenchus okinawaensis]|uniref:Uncharacterized protein n=1 Tax=Bursaphelenchus okinawaensis TaxID=465554 RepID=A0A811L0H2_9BILA|nr:unnamed protein product [Bursaphelenchus okinawaensis]CAG9113970.1 unnamed protein product [Bursaphelenchus okinawaensis]
MFMDEEKAKKLKFGARKRFLSNKENEFEVETNSRLVDITADKALIDKLLTRLDSNGPYPDWQEIEEEMIRLENDPNNHEFRDEGRHGNGETIPTPPTLNTTLIELQSSLPPTTVPFETPPTLPFLLQTTTSSLSETVPTATTVPFNAFDWTTEINIDRSDEITQADSTETLTSQMIDRLVTAMTSGASIKVTVNNSTASAIQGRIDRNYTTHLNRNDDVDITTT